MIINKERIIEILDKEISYDDVKTYIKINNPEAALENKNDYCRFYQLRGNTAGLRSEEFEKFINLYFEILEKYKSEPNVEFKTILKEVNSARRKCKEDNRKEISFSSKLLHTINNERPIWDKRLVNLYNFNLNNDHSNWTEEDCVCAYEEYCRRFDEYMESNNDEKDIIIKEFDNRFQDYKDSIKDIKKVDFVLWRNKPKKSLIDTFLKKNGRGTGRLMYQAQIHPRGMKMINERATADQIPMRNLFCASGFRSGTKLLARKKGM